MPSILKLSIQDNPFVLKKDFKIQTLKSMFKSQNSIIFQISNEKKDKNETKKSLNGTFIFSKDEKSKSGTSLNISDFSNFWQGMTPTNQDFPVVLRPQTSKNMNFNLKLGNCSFGCIFSINCLNLKILFLKYLFE